MARLIERMRCCWRQHLIAAMTILSAAIEGSAVAADEQASWKVGLAYVSITPARPVVLLGYSDRVGPFDSVVQEIYAKALRNTGRNRTRH